MVQDVNITELLEKARTVVVVGCSPKPERDSHRVAAYLQGAGYRVIPVNPVAEEILGLKVYADLAAIPGEIEWLRLPLEHPPPIGPVGHEVSQRDLDLARLEP